MSSHYVLPSNTSPETFPKNHASFFSTPIMNPLLFDGDWEVAVLNITHSNCINTLNKDTMKVVYHDGQPTAIMKTTKIPIPNPMIKTKTEYFNALIQNLNKACSEIATFVYDGDRLSYTFQSEDYFIHLNQHLSDLLQCCNVLTSYDNYKMSKSNIQFQDGQWNKDYVIHIIPTDEKGDVIQLKKANEVIHGLELLYRFKERITTKYPYLKLVSSPSSSNLMLQLSTADISQPIAMIQSKDFHERSSFYQNGVDQHGTFHNFDMKSGFEEEWLFYIYSLENVQTLKDLKTTVIDLGTELFQSIPHLINFLNHKIRYDTIRLKLVDKDRAQLVITAKNIGIEFGKDLQDILAFDKSYYKGICNIKSSGPISLTRRINYFYVYSNIGDMIRIGDIEAPLLCHFPFNPKRCKVITERTFEKPMYVKLKHKHISQIDIGIYDDAGQVIPFNRDAITTLRLHFRRV